MLAARLAVEDLVEELIAAQADVGARDKWGMDVEKLMLCYRETEQIVSVGEDVEKMEHSYAVAGNVNWFRLCEKQL